MYENLIVLPRTGDTDVIALLVSLMDDEERLVRNSSADALIKVHSFPKSNALLF
jgi:hypothetical protein